jgi:hypothetical protein
MAASVALVVAAMLLPSGCSSGSGCASVSVGVASPHLTDVRAAFDVAATLAASGRPLSGVSVEFWAWGSPPGQTSSVGTDLGVAVSGADGKATLHEPALVDAGEVSRLGEVAGTDLVRVSGDVAAGTIAGRAHCAAKGHAPVTDCGPGGCLVKE